MRYLTLEYVDREIMKIVCLCAIQCHTFDTPVHKFLLLISIQFGLELGDLEIA